MTAKIEYNSQPETGVHPRWLLEFAARTMGLTLHMHELEHCQVWVDILTVHILDRQRTSLDFGSPQG